VEKFYKMMMGEAKRIASNLKTPSFYVEHQKPISISKEVYYSDSLVIRCQNMVADQLVDNLGHGLEHAEKVTIDVGAIVYIEAESLSLQSDQIERAVIIAQISGLLHDIKRKEPNHARASAKEAKKRLKDFPLQKEEKEFVIQAISNHEAFVVPKKIRSPIGQIISDSLYDADKFRWGVDNFTDTLWHMTDFKKIPVELIVDRFPRGLEAIRKIKGTFRTDTGRKYGPEFIDLGLEIGDRIYNYLLSYHSSS
jgi:hypothetical protein